MYIYIYTNTIRRHTDRKASIYYTPFAVILFLQNGIGTVMDVRRWRQYNHPTFGSNKNKKLIYLLGHTQHKSKHNTILKVSTKRNK